MYSAPTTPGSSRQPVQPRVGGHPGSASESSKERPRRPVNCHASQSSPSKKPRNVLQGPAIKSRVIPAPGPSATELSLPADMNDAYAALENYHRVHSDMAQDMTKKAATRKRAADKLPRIVATMAALYGPWRPAQWQPWSDISREEFKLESALIGLGMTISNMIPAWRALRLPIEDNNTEARDQDIINAPSRVRKWYNDLCCVTGVSTTQACHIVANSIERNDRSPFWSGLCCFWSTKQVSDLRAYLKTPEAHKRNLVILSRDLHECWSQNRFALKPVMADKNTLHLEFNWLSCSGTSQVSHIQGHHTNIAECRRGEPPRLLQTGDIIELQTIDPEEYPYPDEELLSLQYHLNRVCCASAAPGLLEFLKQDPPDAGGSGATLSNGEEDIPDDEYGFTEPLVEPDYIDYLVDAAVEQHVITAEHGDKWRAYYNGPFDTDTTPPTSPSEISSRQFN